MREPVDRWTWRVRGVIAGGLLLVVLAASQVMGSKSLLLVAAFHVLPALIYTFAFRAALPSALGAVGLTIATVWTTADAATTEHADQKAFYVLTNSVVWFLVLVVVGGLGSALGAVVRRGDDAPHGAGGRRRRVP